MDKYILKAGNIYKIQVQTSFQARPSVSVTESQMMTTYAGQIVNETLKQFQTEIAQEQLTSPELLGWDVYNVDIQSKSVVFATSFFNTNPILKLVMNVFIDGTKAFNDLTINVSTDTPWYQEAVLSIKQFFIDFAYKYDPLILLVNDIHIIAVDIVAGTKKILTDVENAWKAFDAWWYKWWIVFAGVGIFFIFLYIDGRKRK